MIDWMTTHGNRHDDLLQLVILPFRDSDFIQVKNQIANTSVYRFFHFENCGKVKLPRDLQARVFLGVITRRHQIVFISDQE
jgi:hypothetical protein